MEVEREPNETEENLDQAVQVRSLQEGPSAALQLPAQSTLAPASADDPLAVGEDFWGQMDDEDHIQPFAPSDNTTDRALSGLRLVLQDPAARFKSDKQRDLVNAVLEGVHTLAVLPTGSGKSMAFEIPPAVEGRLTLVVVPYRALALQVVDNGKRRGIPIERWTLSSVRNTSARLVVVAVETIVTLAFRE
jgi:superfamily II DNA helicase RecQ